MKPEDQKPDPERRNRQRGWAVKLGLVAIVGTFIARRRGYGVGGNTFVRCRQGHVFTTLWVPLASFKAVRLGWWRFQRCPVGKHWTLVTPVRESDLSPDDLRQAREHRDVRIP